MSDSINRFEPVTLVKILRHRAVHQPHDIAYQFLLDGEHHETRLTYQALDQQAQAIAAHLQSVGGVGTRVLLLYPAGLDYIAALFGCLYAGAIAIPAYPPKPNRSLDRIQAILKDSQAEVALTTQSLLTQIKSALDANTLETTHWLTTDVITASPELLADFQWHEPTVDLNAIALLQYTSGSTAAPKGVMLSHRNLWHNLGAIQRLFNHTAQSKGVIWLPPYHDMGLIGGILQPLYSGFPVVLMPPAAFIQRPWRWLTAISRHRATTSGAPNFAYDRCLTKLDPEALRELDLSSWQVAFNGAEPIRAETMRRFAETFAPAGFDPNAFYPCYGLAEATLIVSGNPAGTGIHAYAIDSLSSQPRPISSSPTDLPSSQWISCGQPLPDQSLLIVDPERKTPCLEGAVGEIWVAGASVAQGYWNQPEATAETFQARLANREEQFLRTGDLGFLRAGELVVTGRLKDLVIIRGQNHYPQDLELTVQTSHPALNSMLGAALALEDNGEQLIVVQEVARESVRQLDSTAIVAAIQQAISTQHDLQVEAIALLKPGSIPKTSSGKVQRYQCRHGFLNKTLDMVALWTAPSLQQSLPVAEPLSHLLSDRSTPITSSPAAPTEEEIQHWLITNLAAYLKVEPEAIDMDAPFAHYGLDSSVAISLTGELADWLGVEQLEPMLFWEHPSIAALASHLQHL